MAGLRELRNRLRSIRTTEQVTNAMRTAASAKYARVSGVRAAYAPYSEACGQILSRLGTAGVERERECATERDCYVLLSSNRGLCGGFNADILRFYHRECGQCAVEPMRIVLGKKAASELRNLGLEHEELPLSDVPAEGEARRLSEHLLTLYRAGEVRSIIFIYQKFRNMLTQIPTAERLLPAETGEGQESGDVLFLPDRDSIRSRLAVSCFQSRVYELLLENASGAQAATLMAMRNASDNAKEAGEKLELTINRRRQSEVTASVIETASGARRPEA